MKSELKLVCDYKYSRTNIAEMYCTPPYKIMHPFMDGALMEVILMSSSAGLLAGDSFDCEIELKKGACLTFTSQSYEKILDTMEDMASRRLRLTVGENACLKYMTLPVIPFANSSFKADNEIFLKETAMFVYSDIVSCGRVGMGERYKMKLFHSKTKIYVEDELVFADNTYLSPEEVNYARIGMWGEFTHSGMLYLYWGGDDPELSQMAVKIREKCEEARIFAGVSECVKGLIVRTLGYSGEELYQLNKTIASLL